MSTLRTFAALGLSALFSLGACAESVTDDVPDDVNDAAAPDAADASHVTRQDAGDAAVAEDAASDDASAPDTSAPDTSVADTSVADTNVPDTSTPVAAKPVQGEVLITEVLFNPDSSQTEPDAEWFEVYNAAASPRQLTGLTLADGSGHSEVVNGSVVVQPGAYVVFARSRATATAAKVPSTAIVYEYSQLTLANGATGGVSIQDGATNIAQAPYGNFNIPTATSDGASIELTTLTYADGAKSTSWCISTIPWASGADYGTPGAKTKCQ